MVRLLIAVGLLLLALSGQPLLAAPSVLATDGSPAARVIPLTAAEKAFLQEHPVIRLGINQDWSPYVVRRPGGELDGLEVDLLRQLKAVTGANLELVAGRWSAIVDQAGQGALDGLAMSVANRERARRFLFTDTYLVTYPCFIMAADNPLDARSLGDFEGKTVALLAGHEFYRRVLSRYPGITLVEQPSELEAVRMVVEGKAAAAVVAAPTYDRYLKSFARAIRVGYVATDHPLEVVFSIRKDWPELVGILNKGLNAFSGAEFTRVFDRWFGNDTPILVRSPARPRFTPEERSWLQQNHRVRIYIRDYPPYSAHDPEHGVQGMTVDYLRLIAARAGFTAEFLTGPDWAEAVRDIRDRRGVDLLPAATVTPERKAYLHFTTPYLKAPSVIYTRRDSSFVGSIEDLADKVVVVEQDYAVGQWLAKRYPEIRLEFRDSTLEALLAVANGEADAYIGNLIAATYSARFNGLTDLMVAAPSPFGSDDRSMAVRRDWPELAGILDKTLATMTPGEHEAIRTRWLPPVHFEYGISRADVLRTVGFSSSLLLLIIGVTLFWNKKLSREVAARSAAETSLRESEGRLRKALNFTDILLDRSPVGICVFDGESGDCIRANRVAAQLAGSTPERLQQQNFRELASWRSAGLDRVAETVLADGVAQQLESNLTTASGNALAARIWLARFFVEEHPHLMTIGQDVSEEKRLATERRQLEEKMLQAQKLESLGVLAGGIAHDFNNILMAVTGHADLALRRLPPAAPAVRHLQQIQTAASRASDLAGQMLAYSGRGRFRIERLDLNHLIADMLPMLRASVSKKTDLRFHPGPQLPAIDGDATQLRQVVMNLVINASEALADQDGVVDITTGIRECDALDLREPWLQEDLPAGSYTFFSVADTGCGMEPETLRRIYEPFFSTKFTGRGLGMAAVQGILRGHHGVIKVQSEVGRGTTCRVLLPALAVSAPATTAMPATREGWQGTGRVLLVDDEEAVREVGRLMLEELGFEVLTAVDGRDALGVYRKQGPGVDLVLLDLAMPHLGGEEAFRELKKLDPAVRVIIASGYDEQEVSQIFAGEGLAGSIKKPFALPALREALCAAGVPGASRAPARSGMGEKRPPL